jgi:hypothetical protein
VQCRLLLDVVVGKGTAILKLLAGEDQALLVRRNAFLVLDLALDVVDRVAGLNLQCDGLAGECLNEDLHTTTETEHQVQRRLLLDVVVRKCAAILQLLTSEDKTLLVRRDTLLVLNLRLHVVDSVRRLNLERDGLASQGLDENLHTTAQTQDEMQCGLLLNVVVGKGTAILKLLAGEDQALLVWGNALLVLNLRLDVVNGIGRLDFQGDGLAGHYDDVSNSSRLDANSVATYES